MTERLNSVTEARHTLGGISHETFYKYVRNGQLRVVKLGRRTFVTNAELDRFIGELSAAA